MPPSNDADATSCGDLSDLDQRLLLGQLREQMFGRSGRVTIGRFEIVTVLGRGTHGTVYLGEDTHLRRRVAVKVLRSSSDDTARARLLREAQALAQLKHPNVLTIHDVGVEVDRVFIAMEYVEGGTLADWCRDHPPGTRARFDQLLDLAVGAARGLAAAHEAGVIHRDVKPANILVGLDGRPRIADFGLARALSERDDGLESGTPDEQADPRLTQTGASVGTPTYMAPEQFAGRGDAASDQFSLCVALWEAAYERRPFLGDSVPALRAAVLQPLTPPPAERREVPGWWRDILMRGLGVDSAARWPSVAELANQLASGRTRARARRFGLASSAVVVAGLCGAALWQVDRERRRHDCAGRADEIATVWNESAKTDLESAMIGTGASFAATSYTHAVPYLDAYADEWRAHYDALCIATEVDGARDGGIWIASQRCLSERRGELAALLARNAAEARSNLGGFYLARRRYDDATREFTRALTLARASMGAGHVRVADGNLNLGVAELGAGRHAEAERSFARAAELYTEIGGDDRTDVALATMGLAAAQLRLRRMTEAQRNVEHALAIDSKRDAELASFRFLLARALWDTRHDAMRARVLAEKARDAYRSEGNEAAAAEVEAWLDVAARRAP